MCFDNLVDICFDLRDYQQAIKYHKRALYISKKTGDTIKECNQYLSLGQSYSRLGYHTQHLEYSEKSLEIAKKTGDTATELECYNQIGLAYKNIDYINSSLLHKKPKCKIILYI